MNANPAIRLIGRSGHNLLVSLASEFAVRFVGLATLVLLARYLEPTGFGYYSALLAYFALAVVFGNLGLDRVAIRVLTGEKQPKAVLFSTILRLRLAAGLITAVLLMSAGSILKPGSLGLLTILAVALIPAAVAGAYVAGFQAHHEFGPPAAGTAAAALAALAATAVGVMAGAPLIFFIIVVLGAESMRAAWIAYAGWRAGWVATQPLDQHIARSILAAALPYGMLLVLGTVHFRIDLLMLDALVGGEPLGHYASAFRILEAAAAVATLVMAVLFPRFITLQRVDLHAARELYLAIAPLMLWGGIVVAAAVIATAEPLLSLIFSAPYAAAAPALVWLMIALALLFLHAPNLAVLFSGERLAPVVWWTAATVLAKAALCGWLIQRYAAVGAAAATAVAELISLAIFTPMVCRRLGLPLKRYLLRLATPWVAVRQLDLLLDRAQVHEPPVVRR